MAIQSQRYIRKPLYVDAVRITAANFEEIAVWCQGEIQQEDVPGKGTSKKFIRVRVQNPKNPRQTKAFVGDWILYTETGYKVYTVKAFHAAFDKVTLKSETVTKAQVAEDPDAVQEHVEAQKLDAENGGRVLDEYAPDSATAEAEIDEIVAADGLPKYPEPEFVPATPEGIAQAVQDNEAARQAEEAGKVEPSATEGRRVLSQEEQDGMTSDEVRELVQAGDVVLAQDIARP